MRRGGDKDYLKWLKTPGGNQVCLLIADNGEIEKYFEGCLEKTSLANAALFLEQSFAVCHYDKHGGPQPWVRLEPCSGEDAGNATVVLIPEGDFRKDMPGREAMAKSLRTLGRVDLSIGC